MESPNIIKVDSKGRILIPVHLRNGMSIEEGTKIIVVPDNNNNHFKIIPIAKDSTAEIKVTLDNSPSSLASVADALSANAFNIILSESRRIGEELTEWKMIVDLSERNDGVERLRDVISNVEGVKSLDLAKK